MSERPDCYKCKFVGSVAGSAHNCCNHPETKGAHDSIGDLFAKLGVLGLFDPNSHYQLGITANPHGVKNGWFTWPWNFDPVWLLTCDGFEATEVDR